MEKFEALRAKMASLRNKSESKKELAEEAKPEPVEAHAPVEPKPAPALSPTGNGTPSLSLGKPTPSLASTAQARPAGPSPVHKPAQPPLSTTTNHLEKMSSHEELEKARDTLKDLRNNSLRYKNKIATGSASQGTSSGLPSKPERPSVVGMFNKPTSAACEEAPADLDSGKPAGAAEKSVGFGTNSVTKIAKADAAAASDSSTLTKFEQAKEKLGNMRKSSLRMKGNISQDPDKPSILSDAFFNKTDEAAKADAAIRPRGSRMVKRSGGSRIGGKSGSRIAGSRRMSVTSEEYVPKTTGTAAGGLSKMNLAAEKLMEMKRNTESRREKDLDKKRQRAENRTAVTNQLDTFIQSMAKLESGFQKQEEEKAQLTVALRTAEEDNEGLKKVIEGVNNHVLEMYRNAMILSTQPGDAASNGENMRNFVCSFVQMVMLTTGGEKLFNDELASNPPPAAPRTRPPTPPTLPVSAPKAPLPPPPPPKAPAKLLPAPSKSSIEPSGHLLDQIRLGKSRIEPSSSGAAHPPAHSSNAASLCSQSPPPAAASSQSPCQAPAGPFQVLDRAFGPSSRSDPLGQESQESRRLHQIQIARPDCISGQFSRRNDAARSRAQTESPRRIRRRIRR
eukprot:TRINITY_DN3962_c0_g1_i1.p1 TRINITY_DN3962_c0_g1~~TRINITY_DN3962_c0_g1_i1.p1  ORF type:complete len:620 (-),score=143.06 TRINITY_DN3962_c0_g1_i1:118-1977(-)